MRDLLQECGALLCCVGGESVDFCEDIEVLYEALGEQADDCDVECFITQHLDVNSCGMRNESEEEKGGREREAIVR